MLNIMTFLLAISVSYSAFAGNSLFDECDGTYEPGKKVTGVNVIANWTGKGPAFNVKVDNTWYVKQFSDNADKGFYQLAYMAYTTQEKVNFCHIDGYFRGIEFANLN